MKKLIILGIVAIAFSCKVDDPFVDRIVSPVLVIFESAGVATNGLTTEPSVTSSASADATITMKLLELDKTGLLDNKVGIDSLPAASVPVIIKFRNGTKVAEGTTDATGKLVITTKWSTMGVAAPVSGSSVLLAASATYKDVPFTKLFRLTATK
jgi:hypothetical protein